MVKVYVNEEKSFYMDGFLNKNLLDFKKKLQNDDDYVMIVDGAERSGKTVLAQQCAWVVDPSFTHERMCFTVEEFTEQIKKAQKGQCVVFDEGYRGFSSAKWADKLNVLMQTTMMEVGQKNLFLIIVSPSFFMLSKYIAMFRSRSLLHVYRKNGNRGYFAAFGDREKQLLYLKGKVNMSYSGKGVPRAKFVGRFLNQYLINEEEYRKKKLNSLNKLGDKPEGRSYNENIEKRNEFIVNLFLQGKKTSEIESILEATGNHLGRDGILLAIRNYKNSILKDTNANVTKNVRPKKKDSIFSFNDGKFSKPSNDEEEE